MGNAPPRLGTNPSGHAGFTLNKGKEPHPG